MADQAKLGTTWHSDELDAIVEDYFVMLTAELSGRPYVKLRHSESLMARIGRTHRSVEFKHQNISAVMDELGMPWISGYKPKRNYQNAIVDAIDRYLTMHSLTLEFPSIPPVTPPSPSGIFVDAPVKTAEGNVLTYGLQRLVRKFDPVERDHRNRTLGKAGEAFVMEVERAQLTEMDRSDLAKRIRWVAAEDGDGAGYDVLSFDHTGSEKLIEVKTTNGSARTPFFLTRNECDLAIERPTDWQIYRVHMFANGPRIFKIAPPLENAVTLHPDTWRATF